MSNKINNALAVVSVLVNEGKIPTKIANSLAISLSVTELRQVVANNALDRLMKIDGIGEKRAATIIKVLTGKIPQRLSESRTGKKIGTREPSIGFSLRSFASKTVMKEYVPFIEAINNIELYKEVEGVRILDDEALLDARQAYTELKKFSNELDKNNMPFALFQNEGTVSRMSRSIGSDIFGIDYTSKKPTTAWITVEHGIQELINFNWHVFGNTKTEAEAEKNRLQQEIEHRLGNAGVRLYVGSTSEESTMIHYGGFAASASHQKDEKLVMADAKLMRLHEEAIWFTMKMSEVFDLEINGAAIWKMRANLLRPIRCGLKIKGGRQLTLNDIEIKEPIVVNRIIKNARKIGELNEETGEIFEDGEMVVEKTLADGTLMSTVELEQWGQTTSYGIKGCSGDGTAPIKYAAKLEGKEVPSMKPILMDGGCWKFDKVGCSWEEFVRRANKLAERYPSLNKLWLLREGDELEDDVKIRRLTRSLIQQWIHLDARDIRMITKKSRKSLNKMKTLKGAINMMAETGREEKSPLGKVFEKAPWLVLNPEVQRYLETRFVRKQREAAACKFKTTGSYPYIQEDFVAIAQIWVFGADANRMDLGVLKAGEMSVADVAPKQKMLAVRFPANYQTAAVRINVPCQEAFASCSNIAMISIYDDILIRQDGDVDGDEMAIILDEIAIAATERMYQEFNPPVVVFAHGGKAPKKKIGNRAGLIETMYNDLWKAKKFDGVGKYANLATLCCHLASLAYARNDMDEVKMRLVQMSLASTGAILAIDQVKGNAVSDELIERLEQISKSVRNTCQNMMPFTQQYVKGLKPDEVLPESDALCDQMAGLIIRDTNDKETNGYKLEVGNAQWNAKEAKRAMLDFGLRTTSLRNSPVPKSILDTLADNWFNDKNAADQETFRLIKAGQPVQMKDLVLLMWRNACALEFRMTGDNLTAKREEYLKVVREMLYTQATSAKWIGNDGHVFTDAEKKASVVNVLVYDALNMSGKGNGIDDDKKGSYAIFVLKVFAKEILWCLERNHADANLFNIKYATATDLEIEESAEAIENILADGWDNIDEDQEVWFSDEDNYADYDLGDNDYVEEC